MKNETLDDIEAELNQEQEAEQAKEGEILTQEQESEAEEKYKAALAKGYHLMGLLCGGVSRFYPFVELAGSEEEYQAFIDKGADKAANVLKKYETPEAPDWFNRWKEEIEAGLFFGGVAYSVYTQVKAHKKAEEEKQKQETEGENGDNGQES